jgi:sirohydrochlorin ferrochelatase
VQDTLLLLVGRGSSDAEATAELAQFARLRSERMRLGRVEICFLALAAPSLEIALQQAGQLALPRIVVQPHLLFAGELLAGLQEKVALAAARCPQQQWLVTSPLGPHPWLVSALVERANLNQACLKRL